MTAAEKSPPVAQGVTPSVSELTTRVRKIIARCKKAGATCEEVASVKAAQKLRAAAAAPTRRLLEAAKIYLLGAVGVALSIGILLWFSGAAQSPTIVKTWLSLYGRHMDEEKCLVDFPNWLQNTMRPPEDCSMCTGVDAVDRVTEIAPDLFDQRYGQSGRPVVIEDAMRNWTAPSVFSLNYLRDLYRDSPHSNCQFFPYKTEFKGLAHFFNMSQERASGKPWYVGWSNCDDRVSRELRRHYSRPYFLPANSENKQLDWIFMGSPGYGAHMHVDNVGHVSWQAQLKGHKLWVLQPPPECLYHCSFLQTILKPGDIIVLDTNRWYHSTLIVSEEISITIGAEFD